MSDWDTVTVLRKRQPKASALKTESAVNQVHKRFFSTKKLTIFDTAMNFGKFDNKISVFQYLFPLQIRLVVRDFQLTQHKNVSKFIQNFRLKRNFLISSYWFEHFFTNQKWSNHICLNCEMSLISIPVGAGSNKQHVITKNTAKLDRETEELKHDKITLDVGKLIQQGRNSKGLSQKDLATVIFSSFIFCSFIFLFFFFFTFK